MGEKKEERMKKLYIMVTLGILAGLALTSASCAPAAAPEPPKQTTTTTQKPPTAEKSAAEKPLAPKPVVEKPAAEKPAPAGATTSVSGIPLEPNARRGGVLRGANATDGPDFTSWEGPSIAAKVGQPVSNQILQNQTWGSRKDYEGRAYTNVHPDLAVSWEQSKDGLQWTFRLRPGVTFSDGDRFACEDAKWTLDTVRTAAGIARSPLAVHFLAIKNIQCPDDLTMVINLKRPKASLPDMIASPEIVVWNKSLFLPKEKEIATDKKELEKFRKEPNIGTGPFTLKERIAGEKYTLIRREDYWDKPFPYLDGIEMQIIAEGGQVTALRAGRLDFGGNGGLWALGPADQLLQQCKVCQVWPKAVYSAMLYSLLPNVQRPPWNTPEVKEALSLAIDRKKLIQIGYAGWGELGTGGLFAPGSFWAMPYERVKQVPGWNFDTPEENKQKARDLLQKAGFKPGELKFTIAGPDAWYRTFWVPMLEDLNAVGFNAEPLPVDGARFYEIMGAGDFNVGGHSGWISGFDPDVVLYEFFYTGAERNYGRYANPHIDRLIEEMSTTQDPQERRRKAWDVAETIMRDQVRSAGGYLVGAPIFGEKVRGIMPGMYSQSAKGPQNRHDHTWLAE